MALCACTLALCGCMDNDVYQGTQEEEKEFNEFNFSTVSPSTSIEVSYLNCGVEAAVYFELYEEMPVTETEYSYLKRDDVAPLFAAYTDTHGVFSGNVELPAYLKKVYIYTPAFFAQTLIEAEVVNGSIKATDTGAAVTRAVTATDKSYDSYMVTSTQGSDTPAAYKSDSRWKTWLGGYDKKKNGEIGYKYTGNELVPSNRELYTTHSQVINTGNACPEEYRSYSDLYVSKAAEVGVTFLGGNTCWNSSLGYYYYKDGEKPSDLNSTNVIMLFPNTQDGYWSKHPGAAEGTTGIDRMTTVQLKYYPNIASGNQDEATDIFPAGTRIGLVLATNAWSNRISGWGRDIQYRAATSEGMSKDGSGKTMNTPRTAVYRIGDHVMISFEDHVDDQNFSDVVITMVSNPADAIIDIPVIDPDKKHTTATTPKGIYAFEDMWPAQGDYDMNDMIVKYTYEKTFDKENLIYSESFIFKTFQNYAAYNNGLAFRIAGSATAATRKYYIRKAGESQFSETDFVYESADNVYRLTDNIKNHMGAEYKVTLEYDSPISKETAISPFIYRNTEGGKRLEVHLPQEAPTSLVDEDYFGKEDDASDRTKGIYYVRSGNYPFAIYLSGATEKDIQKLLDSTNETTPISNLYSGYNGWVGSNGTSNTDWYKEQ